MANYKISTGFLCTPLVLPALSAMGKDRLAFRLLTETECPSWLYPVTMGATTIWERWDSMLPDGSINSGSMTSFNHYALGSVADWIHHKIGGIAPASPGYRSVVFAPIPGGGITSAHCELVAPYGLVSCQWSRHGLDIDVEIQVAPNTTATVILPGLSGEPIDVESGRHSWSYSITEDAAAKWTWIEPSQSWPGVG